MCKEALNKLENIKTLSFRPLVPHVPVMFYQSVCPCPRNDTSFQVALVAIERTEELRHVIQTTKRQELNLRGRGEDNILAEPHF